MKKKFRKGNIVESGTNVILVTGAGNKEVGYDTFAGVVIMAKRNDEDYLWPVGTYSDTWTAKVFKKIDIKLSTLIEKSLNL